MNAMEPIRDINKINEMRDALKGERNKVLFTLGVNTGLRISDLIKLKASDIQPEMRLVEQKTGKTKVFRLSKPVYAMVKAYADKCSDWLFPSRKGDGHITACQYWRIMSEAAKKVGLEHIGTHSMRKTFGYHAYKNGVPLSDLMYALNHSSEAITLRYIGITQETINDTLYSQMAL